MIPSIPDRAVRDIVLWLTFFLICLGLGYPTLGRYDPRKTGGLFDTQEYYELVNPVPGADYSHMRFRLLIPLLARPIYRMAVGHIGTWDPVFLALLTVNAFFTATTTYLLVSIGRLLLRAEAAALLGACLYLLNFETANLRLSGLIDSAEGCFLLAIAWSLLTRRLWQLPLWGMLGALAKESFVPFAIFFTVAWWILARPRERWKPVESLAIFGAGAAACFSVTILQLVVSGHMVWPWQFAAALRAETGHMEALRANVLDRNLFYGFVWLLPLGLLRLNRFPMPWIAASTGTAALAFFLCAYYGAQPGTAARSVFSIAGPLLSLSAAMYLSRTDAGKPRG